MSVHPLSPKARTCVDDIGTTRFHKLKLIVSRLQARLFLIWSGGGGGGDCLLMSAREGNTQVDYVMEIDTSVFAGEHCFRYWDDAVGNTRLRLGKLIIRTLAARGFKDRTRVP